MGWKAAIKTPLGDWAISLGNRFSQGKLAELRLIQHRLRRVEWRDRHYIVTVEPSQSGLQLVQFPRQESASTLPLSLVSTTGESVPVLSGDW